jgi:hypothetical protein
MKDLTIILIIVCVLLIALIYAVYKIFKAFKSGHISYNGNRPAMSENTYKRGETSIGFWGGIIAFGFLGLISLISLIVILLISLGIVV